MCALSVVLLAAWVSATSAAAEAASDADLAAAASSSAGFQVSDQQQQQQLYGNLANYEQQQQKPAKSKKIQIVYIKVPLAKLKPSLDGSSQQQLANSDANSTYNGANANTNSSE